jgi:hypothetical protein
VGIHRRITFSDTDVTWRALQCVDELRRRRDRLETCGSGCRRRWVIMFRQRRLESRPRPPTMFRSLPTCDLFIELRAE